MIKDLIVALDGSESDARRIAAAEEIAMRFDAQITGLFINTLPYLVSEETIPIERSAVLMDEARTLGDRVESELAERLSGLSQPSLLRRYDVVSDMKPIIARREARAADTFVALRPNGGPLFDTAEMVEEVLFGSGRHVFLATPGHPQTQLHHVVVAWNGTRESARALSEALPYLEQADKVTVLVIVNRPNAADQMLLGTDAVAHLLHHGVEAELQRSFDDYDDIGTTLLAEVNRLQADLVVIGGYGHSRFREWLLGGVTQKLLKECPVPLVIAH